MSTKVLLASDKGDSEALPKDNALSAYQGNSSAESFASRGAKSGSRHPHAKERPIGPDYPA